MKGLILCAGKGTRMRPITYAVPKMLIPVANKPVIQYAVDAMKAAGIRRIGLVVSENRKELEPALGDGKTSGVKFEYIMQNEQKGIAHAVLCAEEFIGKDDFVLYLGDNLIEEGIKGVVSEFRKNRPGAAITLTPVPEPRHFGVAVVKDGNIVSIEEKPKKPKSNLAVCGIYVFTSRVFEAARGIKPSRRGEYEITDTISEMIRMGFVVTPHVIRGWWRDTGQKKDMIEANQAVLDGIKRNVRGNVDLQSAIEGRVIIEEGASIERSRVLGPSIIGKNATVSRSYIGPHTSIGDGAVVEDSEIENSIVMSGARISRSPFRIESSLIGNKATIEGGRGLAKKMNLNLGDLCSIEIG
jgi:glucose-1-phosphate thymidylyltransferase